MKDVLLFGEPRGLFIAEEAGDSLTVNRFSEGIAGAEVNVAVGLSRLGFQVDFVTKLGANPYGYFIQHVLREEGIATDNVLFDQTYRTGLQIKEEVYNDQPASVYYGQGSAFSTITAEDVKHIDFSDIRLFHITGLPPAVNPSTREAVFYLLEQAKAADCFITFELNLQPALWESKATMIAVLNQMAEYADIVFLKISDGKLLTGHKTAADIAGFYHQLGVYAVIIRDKGNGTYISEKNRPIQCVPARHTKKTVDTAGTGAGFVVGFISGFLTESAMDEAVLLGNDTSSSIEIEQVNDSQSWPLKAQLAEDVTQNFTAPKSLA